MTDDSSLVENYRAVFDERIGFGRRPAVLSIDFLRAYTTPGAPFYAEGVVRAVGESVALYDAARAAGVPVIYSRVFYDPDGLQGGMFVRKVPALRALTPDSELAAFDPRIAPKAGDLVFVKHYPSSFFGTSLASLLASQGIDTLILSGCSTSGCVRATAIDGVSYGYRVIVPEECVGDRHDGPHRANLFDIHAKYGDVVPKREALDYLGALRAGGRAA
jgi:maleamate amidohydrolase